MRYDQPRGSMFRPLALIATFALLFAACSSAATPKPTPAPTTAASAAASAAATQAPAATLPPKFTVRFLASAGALGDWAPYVGRANGLFTAANIDFQYSTFANPADVFNAIVSGQGDLAIISLPTALTAALQGAPAKLISAAQISTPTGGYDSRWVVLPNSPINTPADLKGKKVHIFAQASLAQAITRSVLAKAGVQAGQYEELSIPFAQAFTALESKQVDTALLIEPFYSNSNTISKTKYGGPLKVLYQYMTFFTEGVNVTGMMANTTWAAANKAGLQRFLKVWLEAVKWGNDPANRELLKAIMANGAGVTLDSVKEMVPAGGSADGKFIAGFLPKFQQLLVDYKMVKDLNAPIAEDRFVDYQYLP